MLKCYLKKEDTLNKYLNNENTLIIILFLTHNNFITNVAGKEQ